MCSQSLASVDKLFLTPESVFIQPGLMSSSHALCINSGDFKSRYAETAGSGFIDRGMDKSVLKHSKNVQVIYKGTSPQSGHRIRPYSCRFDGEHLAEECFFATIVDVTLLTQERN